MCKSENFYKPKERGRNSVFLLKHSRFFDFLCAMKKFPLALISALPLAAGADIDRIGGTLAPSHDALLQRKRYIDMTGNNANHPNKFLISVYAQTILNLLEK